MGVLVQRVSADTVRPLRQRVLRPHQAPEELVYAGDDEPGTLHAAVRDAAGVIVGVATVSREPHPRDPAGGDWRIRGMATAPEARGTGLGAQLLAACLEHVRAQGGARVWCNARVDVQGFYAREGLTVEGDEFELPGIGPHVLMAARL